MEIFQEMSVLNLEEQTVDAFFKKIKETLPKNWSNHSIELTPDINAKYYCYKRQQTQSEPESFIAFFYSKESKKLRLANIVPLSARELTIRQYNNIFSDFNKNCIQPHKSHLPNLAIPTSDDNMINYISKETENKLNTFSLFANKSTGSSHPSDSERWLEFVIAAHKDQKQTNQELTPDFLKRWLIEVLGWSEDIARDLAHEYVFAIGVLKHYDKTQ